VKGKNDLFALDLGFKKEFWQIINNEASTGTDG
jgi:hypothetical protein